MIFRQTLNLIKYLKEIKLWITKVEKNTNNLSVFVQLSWKNVFTDNKSLNVKKLRKIISAKHFITSSLELKRGNCVNKKNISFTWFQTHVCIVVFSLMLDKLFVLSLEQKIFSKKKDANTEILKAKLEINHFMGDFCKMSDNKSNLFSAD